MQFATWYHPKPNAKVWSELSGPSRWERERERERERKRERERERERETAQSELQQADCSRGEDLLCASQQSQAGDLYDVLLLFPLQSSQWLALLEDQSRLLVQSLDIWMASLSVRLVGSKLVPLVYKYTRSWNNVFVMQSMWIPIMGHKSNGHVYAC